MTKHRKEPADDRSNQTNVLDARRRAVERLATLPIYTPEALTTCKANLKLKVPDGWEEVAGQIEALGFGFLKAQSITGKQEPREGIKPLQDLAKAAEAMSKSFRRVQKLQESNRIIRQVLPNGIGYPGQQNTVNWDEADDAVRIIADLGVKALSAATSIRDELGKSPRKNDAGFAWTGEIFRLYRAHDVRGKLGNRDAGGPFLRFLRAAAEPLGLKLSWPSVHDRISQDILHRDGTPRKKMGRSVPE